MSQGSTSWSASNPLCFWEAILSIDASVAMKKSGGKNEGVIFNV